MKVLRLNYLTGIVLLWLAIPGLAAEWSFDKMIGEVESKLPLLEKQAQVIVKMLNSEKHRQQIEADLAKSCGKDLLGSNTYLYRVLKKLAMPLEETVINAKRIFKVKGYRGYYYGGLEWFFLLDLSTGGTRFYSNPIYKEAGFLDESKAQQLVNVANRLMKIQKTVMLAKQKLSKNDCVVKNASYSYDKTPSRLSKREGRLVYDFLFNATRYTVSNKGKFFQNLKPVGGRYPSKVEKYPTIYLEYLMSLASYLEEEVGIGEMNGFEIIDWDQVRKNLKAILAQKAETLELDDLL